MIEVDEEALWARLGKQAVELEILRAEVARLTERCQELEAKDRDGDS